MAALNADDGFALLIAYEMVALASRRVPTVTYLCQRHRWLIPAVLAVAGLHLGRRPTPVPASF